MRSKIIKEIKAEREKQEHRFGEQNHPNGTSLAYGVEANFARSVCDKAFRGGNGTWFHILNEEVKEAFAEESPAKLREELIQVAAVTLAWVECIDRGKQT